MHEMAAHQEYVPYLAHKFYPAQILVLLARSARLEPECDVKHCLYYTWKDIFFLVFFVWFSSGVSRSDAEVWVHACTAYTSKGPY
jgi:hypothetical protein